ncbi:MAG: hypothetical protein NXY59_04530 [Aigarchaeota archaeon]|nr:hypothetical protein [Candidatus Pelearchaeum maunauluense]
MRGSAFSGIDREKILGLKTLIIGEAGSGKTRALAELLERLVAEGHARDMVVIDLAPPRMGKIGGTITEYIKLPNEAAYLRPSLVYAPRTQACNMDDVIRYAKHNAENARLLFKQYMEKPRPLLAINDLTIFLHAGELDELLNIIKISRTFIGTAYYGSSLAEDYGSGISLREKLLVEELKHHMDRVVML